MQSQQPTTERGAQSAGEQDGERVAMDGGHEVPCPVCGAPMPDLKGGKASICPVCGFKDSCCY